MWTGLIPDAHPSVTLVGAVIVASSDRIGKGEESSGVAARGAEALNVETVFMIEHALKAFAGDITLAMTVDCVAYGHIVRRDGFGNS